VESCVYVDLSDPSRQLVSGLHSTSRVRERSLFRHDRYPRSVGSQTRIAGIKRVEFSVLDASLADGDLVQDIRWQCAEAPIIVLSDVATHLFPDVTAVIPLDFTAALAIELRREIARRRRERGEQ